jgi:hypothetical protein
MPTKKTTRASSPDVAVVDAASVAGIAKSLREIRFGAAGAKAKNTALSRMMRKERARLLGTRNALAISAKKA